MTVDQEKAILAQSPLEVEVLNAAVSSIGREPVLLFELSVVAVHNGTANTELDPVLVLWRLFCCCRHCLAIGCFAGAQHGGGKGSRANQHKEFARYTYHKADVSI